MYKLVLLALACCLLFGLQKLTSAPCVRKLEQRIGKEIFLTLSSPTQVTYFSESGESELSSNQIRDLQRLLLNDAGYYFDRKKKCLFIPQKKFLFKKAIGLISSNVPLSETNQKSVTVIFSLVCKQVKISSGDENFILDIDPKIVEIQQYIDNF